MHILHNEAQDIPNRKRIRHEKQIILSQNFHYGAIKISKLEVSVKTRQLNSKKATSTMSETQISMFRNYSKMEINESSMMSSRDICSLYVTR
jgi:hypothetical protein